MKLLLVSLGLVFLTQVSSFRLGCSLGCGTNCQPKSCGCGFYNGCGLENDESGAFGRGGFNGFNGFNEQGNAVPMVVRPQELPKPAISATAALSLTPVPGPGLHKKVIVKPAVLPKPVCRPTEESYVHHHQHSSFNSHSQYHHAGDCDCRPVLYPDVGGVAGYRSCAVNEANCAPADAVSLALAYKMAQEKKYLGEDKLAFGFRKIPVELPPPLRILRKNNVPEEKIFALNGQIVELKPVAAGSGSRTSLDEEAAEDLLALENEEAEEFGIGGDAPIKTVSLGELGYAPARLRSPAFVDVTPVVNAVSEAVDEYSSVHGDRCKCSCGGRHTCKVIPGEVEYKTVPKPEQICLPPVPVPDSCESNELECVNEHEPGCTCSCIPVVMKKCHHHCHKKSSVTIQKLLS